VDVRLCAVFSKHSALGKAEAVERRLLQVDKAAVCIIGNSITTKVLL
jgi:hypothetical protein